VDGGPALIAVDTNVLVYAHREEMARHRDAQERLIDLAESPESWAVPVFCLGEFLRVVTHPRLLDPPSTLVEAFAFLDALAESPSLRILAPGPRFTAHLREVALAGDARGNLAFDAQIAALCAEHAVTRLLTLDRDFSRFPGIEIEPLPQPPAS
jgi:toxin-antitoxin system PIN domain toxin